MTTIGNRYMTPDQEITAESAVYAKITQQLRSPPQIIPDPSGIYVAGIFTPTATLTNLVTAAAPKVQLALESVSQFLITAVPMEDLSCGSLELSRALERVMKVYHPRIFSPTSETRLLFDQRRINFKVKPTVVVYQSGTASLEYDILNVMIPLFRQGDIAMSAARPGRQGVDIPWEVGSVVMVNGKADLHVEGAGRLGLVQIIWNTTVFERQR